VAPSDPATLYATDGAGLWTSSDHGDSWAQVGAGLPGPQSLVSLAVDPADDQLVYCGTATHGVYRSTDGGAHFLPMNQGLAEARVSTLLVDPASPGTLFAGAAGRGVFRWTAAAGRWRAIGDGLPVLAGGPLPYEGVLALDPVSDLLYAATPLGIYRLAAPEDD
jgi:hypothetical protein